VDKENSLKGSLEKALDKKTSFKLVSFLELVPGCGIEEVVVSFGVVGLGDLTERNVS